MYAGNVVYLSFSSSDEMCNWRTRTGFNPNLHNTAAGGDIDIHDCHWIGLLDVFVRVKNLDIISIKVI